MAKGEYIARQDCDDISYLDRFEKQVEFMEQHSEVDLLGGSCDDLYEDGLTGQWGYYSDEELKTVPFIKNPFAHSTIIMRAAPCIAMGGYDESFKTSQDFEFWMRFAKAGKISMLADSILKRRIVEGSISNKRRWRQFYDSTRARWKHNSGSMRVKALYYGVRNLIIGLLPYRLIAALKKIGYL